MSKLQGPEFLVVLLLTQAAILLPAQNKAAEFAQTAYAALPVEEPYAFHKALSDWREPLRRDPAARPSASESQIPPQGWRLLTRAGAGLVLQTASEEFRDYLERS